MGTEIEHEINEIIDLDSPIPCDGLNTVRPDGTPVAQYPCERPATWRWTVYCCGTRSSFSCDAHKEYDGLAGAQCARCNTLHIEVSWRRL